MKGTNRFKKLWQQKLLFLLICGGILGAIVIGVNIKFSANEQKVRSKIVATKIENANDNMNHVARWTAEMGAERQVMQKELEKVRHDLDRSNKELAKTKQDIKNNNAQISAQFKSFQNDINHSIENSIKNGLDQVKTSQNNAKPACEILQSTEPFKSVGLEQQDFEVTNNQIRKQIEVKKLGFGVMVVELEYQSNNNIGAGDIVEATLLSGVVASTATNSSSNPRPVLLELLDGVESPAKWFFSENKKCFIIGAAHGSISDERVYVRLETLRCINRETGKSVETTVSGYVADESGRAGIRGTVITRDRQFLMNSMLGGTLAGAANAFGQLANPTSNYNAFTGNVTQTASTKNLLKQAGGQGIGSALDRYAKYQIERAQMLEPVIQISAGRRLDVVFTKGISLGELKRERNIKQTNTPKTTRVNDQNVTDLPELDNTDLRGREMVGEFIEDTRRK